MTGSKRPANQTSATPGLCADLLAMRPAYVDEARIRRLVPGMVETLAEVGRAFDVAFNTIKTSWRPAGMPDADGAYILADVLIWRLKYLAELEGRKRSPEDLADSELDRKQAEEELRKIRLQNDKLEREEQVAAGKLIDRESVGRAIRTLLAVLAERLTKLPSKWNPFYPLAQAVEWTVMQERDIRRELDGVAEATSRDVLRDSEAA